ncbi:MAG TPA: S8 family serine peptidase, partial [Coriobacteriia bacterium]
MKRAVVLAAGLILVLPGTVAAARFAVGVVPGASLERVAGQVRAHADHRVSANRGLRAVFVRTSRPDRLRTLPGVSYVERLAARKPAFTPNDPLLVRQWYLGQIKAFDFWLQMPSLPTVPVAVVDSGIDGGHPELSRRIEAAKSFVGGSALQDSKGHGTFVAGEIAASTNNAVGMAGIAFPARLLIAKVVAPDGSIPLEAEAKAIVWAANHGARVINLSLAGLRDPLNPGRDSYSALEASAIRYAYRKGALVVAAVGNADQAPRTPWNFAGYPAALPHVLGVSALTSGANVADFSNRDVLYNDLSAPGVDIFSTLPRAL